LEKSSNCIVRFKILSVGQTQLQRQVAKLMGKEAGLFVASGTMGNLISVLVHCEVSAFFSFLEFAQ
jgi:hypothetical protein